MKLWQELKPTDQATWPEAFDFISRYSFFDNPSHFSRVLAEQIEIAPDKSRLLDIGSATGITGLYSLIAKKAAFVTFTDITQDGICESRSNVIRQLELGRIREEQVDFIGPIAFAKIDHDVVAQHTMIAFNPPQLPLNYLDEADVVKILNDKTMRYYRSGGPDGLKTVRSFLRWYGTINTPRPDLVMNLSSFLGRRKIEKLLRDLGHAYRIVETKVPLRERLIAKIHTFTAADILDRGLTLSERDGNMYWTKLLLTIFIYGRQ